MTPAIELRATRRAFGPVVALDSVSLTIAPGEFFALLGPSGSGKTTCLRLIAGFDQPDSGTILLDGEDVTNTPPFARNVNTVFQDYALFPHMTVAENVAYGLRVRGVAAAERAQQAAAMLDLVRLECTVIAPGDERATHAARELAVGRLGADGATTMLDGIAFLMQAIRSDRAGPFGFLPPCCAVVSPDERDLVAFIRACRFSNAAIIESRAMQLAQGLEGERLIVAGRALAAASRAPGHCDRTAQQDAFWDVSAPSLRVLH